MPSLLKATLLLLVTSLALPTEGAAAAPKLATPSLVQGVKVTFLKSDGTILSLSWRANPAQEKVDRYAIYFSPGNPNDPPFEKFSGRFVALTAANSYTIYQKQSKVASQILGLPWGGMSQGKGNGSYFWVIAHNNTGWGANVLDTPNPGEKYWRYQYPLALTPLYVESPCPAKPIKDYPCENP